MLNKCWARRKKKSSKKKNTKRCQNWLRKTCPKTRAPQESFRGRKRSREIVWLLPGAARACKLLEGCQQPLTSLYGCVASSWVLENAKMTICNSRVSAYGSILERHFHVRYWVCGESYLASPAHVFSFLFGGGARADAARGRALRSFPHVATITPLD